MTIDQYIYIRLGVVRCPTVMETEKNATQSAATIPASLPNL